MPDGSTNIKIFVAFAPRDEEYLERIVKVLSVLPVEIWHSGQLVGGAAIAETVSRQLAEADIILPLLSFDYIALNFEAEIQRHKRTDALVIPLLLHSCLWKIGYYGQLKVLPEDAKPVTRLVGDESNQITQDTFLNEIAEKLYELVTRMRQPGYSPEQSGYMTGPGGQAPPPPPPVTDPARTLYGEKLYLLCDRYPQSNDFETIIPGFLQETTSRKVRCFALVGDFPEQHASLIERFKHQYVLPHFKGKKTPVDDLIVPKYVMDTLDVGKANVCRKLAEKVMPEKGHQITALDILNTKTGYNVVMIQHNIMSSDWNKDTNKLIKWYLTEFWNVEFQQQHPHVFIFLNVILPDKSENKGLFSGLFGKPVDPVKNLDDLAKELQASYFLLDPLEPVKEDEVQQWFLDYAREMNLDEDQIIQELYAQQPRQPMKKVENTLKTAIQKALKL